MKLRLPFRRAKEEALPGETPAAATLSADAPLTDPEDDKLGYAPLAKHLASSLLRMAPPEGFVISIHGEWGSGKTTLLNFVEYYLKASTPAPIILHFNPWWFAGQDLTMRFFKELNAALGKKGVKELRGPISRIAKLGSFIPPISGVPISGVAGAAARWLASGGPTAEDLKNDAAKALRGIGYRIVVVVDDIDRLTAPEVRQLFQAVKALGDLPNMAYVLAFERRFVAEALAEIQPGTGDDYLEKIIQVTFDLPRADKLALRQMLTTKLDVLIEATPPGHFDNTHWGNLFLGGIQHMVRTPRDVVRLVNNLDLLYPKVGPEVDFADYVALEAIRLNFPNLYYTIRDNGEMFCGTGDSSARSHSEQEAFNSLHKAWLAALPEEDQQAVQDLVLRMFPRVESVWRNNSYSYSWEETWRRERRICSSNAFPVYFQLSVPAGDISNVQIQAFLGMAPNADDMAAELRRLAARSRPDGSTEAKALLAYLEAYTQDGISIDNVCSVIEAIILAGDDLIPEREPPGTWIRSGLQADRILYQLSLRLTWDERYEVSARAIQRSESISLAVNWLSLLGDLLGEREGREAQPEEKQVVNADHLKELREIVLRRIREAAANGRLLDIPELSGVLHRWREWAGDAEVTAWFEAALKDEKSATKLFEAFSQYTISQGMTDMVGTRKYRLNPNWFRWFTEPSKVAERAKTLPPDNPAVKELLLEWAAIEKGIDPDGFGWEPPAADG